MCSPDLTAGLCTICTGPLTPETTHTDRDGNTWDVHKGVCALEAGEFSLLSPCYQRDYSYWIHRMRNASTPEVRRTITKAFSKWVRTIATENHQET